MFYFIKYHFKHNYNKANDDPCKDERNGLYHLLDEELRNERWTDEPIEDPRAREKFHVSQAIWTPDSEGKVIVKWSLNFGNQKPNLYRWTETQYQNGGPFDEWLRTVNTCRSRLACCNSTNMPAGYGNIIMRDFPTPEFGSEVVNKNFQWARGAELDCEKEERVKDKIRKEAEAEAARLKALELAKAAQVTVSSFNFQHKKSHFFTRFQFNPIKDRHND